MRMILLATAAALSLSGVAVAQDWSLQHAGRTEALIKDMLACNGDAACEERVSQQMDQLTASGNRRGMIGGAGNAHRNVTTDIRRRDQRIQSRNYRATLGCVLVQDATGRVGQVCPR